MKASEARELRNSVICADTGRAMGAQRCEELHQLIRDAAMRKLNSVAAVVTDIEWDWLRAQDYDVHSDLSVPNWQRKANATPVVISW